MCNSILVVMAEEVLTIVHLLTYFYEERVMVTSPIC